MDTLYTCDPAKNTTCKKTYCHLNGGECTNTHNLDFAKQPLETVKFVLSAEEAAPIQQAIDEDKEDKE